MYASRSETCPSPNVLVRQLGSSHESLVCVAQLVVDLVALTQTAEDEDGLIHSGFRHLQGEERTQTGSMHQSEGTG